MMKSLLIVDDDVTFASMMAERLSGIGFEVKYTHDVASATTMATEFNPEYALVDLKMPGESGLELIAKLIAIDPETRIVVLTGYAGITTAVEAIKLGAVHYLAKPVSTQEIIDAFHKNEGDPTVPVEVEAVSWNVAEHEHIISSFMRNNQNISATARELKMHRRTLQRKLDKIPGRYYKV